ncbi:MAG: DUF975 family protein [Prevotella sp.]|nr:DUF975 family protein [Prevotella sp.]
MESIKVYKERALTSLKGNWGKGAVATLVYFLLINLPPIVVGLCLDTSGFLPAAVDRELFIFVWQIVLLPVSWGFSVFFFDISRGKNVRVGSMFDGMKQYGRIFTTEFLVMLYMILWMMLPIIFILILYVATADLNFFFSGVAILASLVIYFYKYYSYAMVPYILKDNPEIKNNKAINLSMKMMEDYKTDLFLLDLSMIGWFILSILTTCGIGFLLLIPYVKTVHAHFYEEVKQDLENSRRAFEALD